MTRLELTSKTYAELKSIGLRINANFVDECVLAMHRVIADELRSGGKVSLSGVGTLTVKDVPEHKGHNPKTGEPVIVPARKKIVFSTSSALKEDLRK